jgi:hypothetical protein
MSYHIAICICGNRDMVFDKVRGLGKPHVRIRCLKCGRWSKEKRVNADDAVTDWNKMIKEEREHGERDGVQS